MVLKFNSGGWMEKRKNRSDSYQHLLLEVICSHDMMSSFSNNDSIYNKLNPYQYNEDLLDLEDQLKVEFWRVVETLLTDRQKQVLKLYAEGYTQMEIAKKLKVNQSSITKSLNGNVDYKHGKRVYGGCRKKIRKIIETDEKIKDILKRMQEIRMEKW
jgi:DNA-binding CsgD family transcriptional regulator